MVRFTIEAGDDQHVIELGPGVHRLERLADGATVFIEASRRSTIRLDGVRLPSIVRGGQRLAATRVSGESSMGARRLEVDERHLPTRIDLLPASAGHALDEFFELIKLYANDFPRFRGPFWFQTPDGRFRSAVDPSRVFTFARDNAPLIVGLLADIEDRHATRVERIVRRQPAGHPIATQATIDLLLERPELLGTASPGIVQVRGLPVSPMMVAVERRRDASDTLENRRLAAFLRLLLAEVDVLCRGGVLPDTALRLALVEVRRTLEAAFLESFLSRVDAAEVDVSILDPVGMEIHDHAYQRLHQLRVEYLSTVSPAADVSPISRRYLPRPDELFQLYCCRLVGEAFNLRPCDIRARRRTGVSFSDGEWDLITDSVGALPSWRDASSRPDGYRPDIVLRRRSDPKQVILLDAKYSISDAGRVPGERLKEVQAYLNSFGLRRAGVLYPSPIERVDHHHDVAGQENLLRELPVGRCVDVEIRDVLPALRRRIAELESTAGEVGYRGVGL